MLEVLLYFAWNNLNNLLMTRVEYFKQTLDINKNMEREIRSYVHSIYL